MFDQKNAFMERAAALCKAGLVAAGQVICDMKYAVDFFADFITEWNPNQASDGKDETSYTSTFVRS